VESWRRFDNTLRPHGSLGYRPPAPEVFIPQSARAAALHRPAPPPALAPKPIMHSHSTWTARWGMIKFMECCSITFPLRYSVHLEVLHVAPSPTSRKSTPGCRHSSHSPRRIPR
jgi:hypothetical protein